MRLMALHTSMIQKKAEFVRHFIYEYTVLNLLNEEYEMARSGAPREVFVENRMQNLRMRKNFHPEVPEVSKSLSCATLESKLMDQMYRYRQEFFCRQEGRQFAVRPIRASKSLTPDELLLMNIDVSATVYNIVESVST